MELPRILQKQYRGPVLLAVGLTFVGWNAFGFGWFGLPSLGFVTAGGAERLAVAKMETVAVPLASQLCALKFSAQDPAVVASKTEKLKAASHTYTRGDQLENSWVTLGDSRDTNQRVVEGCVDLILAKSPQKDANLTK